MTSLLKELWQRRSLVFLLAFTDVKLRYKNSILGFFWTFLEPLLMLSVLYFVFTNIIRTEIENYPLYLLLGLILWYMFSRSTSTGMTSLTDRAPILQKIYFRREIVVISSSLTSFIMMLFEFAAFGLFLGILQFIPTLTITLLPLVLIDLFILSLGFSFILATLNVFFKDIRFIWQVVLQAGFFLSPIIYTLDMFPPHIQSILELNPFTALLNIAHDVVLYDSLPEMNLILYVIISTTTIFLTGYFIFKYFDKKMIEVL